MIPVDTRIKIASQGQSLTLLCESIDADPLSRIALLGEYTDPRRDRATRRTASKNPLF